MQGAEGAEDVKVISTHCTISWPNRSSHTHMRHPPRLPDPQMVGSSVTLACRLT
jgi:hypothetical protein